MLPPTAFDNEGFLRKLADWNMQVARQIAAAEALELTPAHWEVLHLLRAYYLEYDSSPAMRALVKYCAIKLGADKGKSIYLMSLFPGSPAKIGIAGRHQIFAVASHAGIQTCQQIDALRISQCAIKMGLFQTVKSDAQFHGGQLEWR